MTETPESIPSTDKRISDRQIRWSEIPSPPLERIYSFLPRADQINMSQVCRKWSEGFSSPSVWKTFRFCLTGPAMDSCPEIKFARRYSSMFRHVEIACSRIDQERQINYTSWRYLKVFLNILTDNSQLHSFKFRFIGNLYRLDLSIYIEIYRSFRNFLPSQHHLNLVEFHECFFHYEEAVTLLKDIARNSEDSLTHLVLRGFVKQFRHGWNRDWDSYVSQSLLKIMNGRFHRLTTLETDYSTIFGKMFPLQATDINALKNSPMRALSKIILHWEGYGELQNLTPATWRYLRQLCPDLQVEVYFVSRRFLQREIDECIQPDMPIALLDYRLHQDSANIEIDVLFNHLLACRTTDYLVSLYLNWKMPIHDLGSTFIPFLQACTKLKCLQLFTTYPANGIEILLRSWLDNRPTSLEEVLISVTNVINEDDYMSLMSLADEFIPVLQVMALNAFLIFYRGW